MTHPVALIVVDEDGVRRPGWALRAGDMIERTDYDYNRRVIEVHCHPEAHPPALSEGAALVGGVAAVVTLLQRLAIIALCLAALAVGVFAATAKAAPFTPELEADFAYAAEWWGATPSGCSSLTRETVPTLPNDYNGEATIPVAGAAPIPCIVVIREGLQPCEQREVVLHEYGHLLGYGHSEDPADVMYPSPTGALCRGVLAATFAAELRHEVRRCRRLWPGRHRRECWRHVREERRAIAGFLEESGPTLLRRP